MNDSLPKVTLMCHLARSGGTSICDWFRTIYGLDLVKVQTDPKNYDFLGDVVQNAHKGVRFFSGHVPLDTLARIRYEHANEVNVKIITNIRNPIDHFYSLFSHQRRLGASNQNEDCLISIKRFYTSFDIDNLEQCFLSNPVTRAFCGVYSGRLTSINYIDAIKAAKEVDFFIPLETLGASLNEFASLIGIENPPHPPELNANIIGVSQLKLNYERDIFFISQLMDFDLRLYAYLKHRGRIDIRSSHTLQPKSYLSGSGAIHVSEEIRRSKWKATAPPHHFEFRNNDLFLHPPALGRSLLEADLQFPQSFLELEFSTMCALTDLAASPILFEVRATCLRNAFDVVTSTLVRPGEKRQIKFSLPNALSDVRLSFSTSLGEQGGNIDSAWATFEDPILLFD